jgi:hypothetical protein
MTRLLDRTEATDRLTAALVVLAAKGRRPRCGDPITRDMWMSDFEAERARAAQWCTGCPVLAECRAAAEANAERFAVWGGRDWTRPRREQAA